MFKKDLGIVICNFNKVDYLKGCLETLYKSDFDNLTYDVIVVDNASQDGSSNFIRENYPQIILLENETNLGGSGGFDRGIRYAIDREYSYIVLLDNDISLEENTILNLFKYIKANPQVGVVGSKICTMDNQAVLQEMGSFIDFEDKFNVYTPLKSHKDDDSLPDFVVCDYVPACCMITSYEVLNQVGSFNTDHFIYWDDMDWCTRVKRAGYEIHAISSSRVYHKMGSNDNKNTFGMYYYHRNRIVYFLKYLKEENFTKFCSSISNWLLNLTFFCNAKQDHNAALVAWFIVDDIINKNLGRQDSRILERKNYKEGLLREKEIVFDFMENNSGLEAKIDTYLRTINLTLVQTPTRIKYWKVIPIEHVLEINAQDIIDENIVYIDNYLNILFQYEIDEFRLFYKQYTNIFHNIFSPIIIEKLTMGRKLYNENSNN